MKENLQDKLVDILAGIQGAVSKGSDFVLAELPDIAQQYIAFGRAWSIIDLIFCFALAGISIGLIAYALKSKEVDMIGMWSVPRCISLSLGGLGGMLSIIGIAGSSKNLILVWSAPKVWLLMEIAKMVKS